MIFALLPVKDPRRAKQRLAALLSPAEREELARLMYRHVLAALTAARNLDRVVVVTSDSQAAAEARAAGADVFLESDQASHSASADAAARRAMAAGARTVLLAPIDVPLVTTVEFEELAAQARSGVTIVPSADGTGTNALVRTPPDAIPSRFGPGSFQAHMAEACARGIEARVASPPGLVFDVDTPEDLREFLARAPNCTASRWINANVAAPQPGTT
jgi:2-phospho-L-lactate guanylyltransferase